MLRVSTFLLGDFGEVGPLLDELCKLKFIVFLVFKEFADLEASQFTADIVLRLHCI